MIRYSMKWGAEVYLNVEDTNTSAPIEAEGNAEWVSIILDSLAQSYGAFGHLIGGECTASDLAIAMNSPEMQVYEPKLIEGGELTKITANIPKGAIT